MGGGAFKWTHRYQPAQDQTWSHSTGWQRRINSNSNSIIIFCYCSLFSFHLKFRIWLELFDFHIAISKTRISVRYTTLKSLADQQGSRSGLWHSQFFLCTYTLDAQIVWTHRIKLDSDFWKMWDRDRHRLILRALYKYMHYSFLLLS